MSNQSGSTEPLSNDEPPALIGRLRPSNTAACRAFSAVVDALLHAPDESSYHFDFVTFDCKRVPLAQFLDAADPGDISSASSNAEVYDAATDDMVFPGYYFLSYEQELEYPRLGWRVGCGKPKSNKDTADVDLRLAQPAHGQGLRGEHARFSFDRECGLLTITAVHSSPVILDGRSFSKSDGS